MPTKKSPAKATENNIEDKPLPSLQQKNVTTKKTKPQSTKNTASKTSIASKTHAITETAEKITAKNDPSKKHSDTTTSKPSTSSKNTKTNPSKSKKDYPFEVNCHIFYPNEGIGKITNITEREFEGEKIPYYTIEFRTQKMVSHIPVRNTKLLQLRKIISKSTAQKVLLAIKKAPENCDLSWKDRLLKHQEIIKKGNTLEMTKMIVALHARNKTRGLSFQERQYYDFALEAISNELAIVLGLEFSESLENTKVQLNLNYKENLDNQHQVYIDEIDLQEETLEHDNDDNKE